MTSLDKALSLCEILSTRPQGLSVRELAREARLPASTVHRLLAGLRRRGYVVQDEESLRYALSLKMLDLSFRALGRSEVRLHAYPVLREYALRSGLRTFVAVGDAGEVTYVWSTGPDEVAMHTAYGKRMPGHCADYFDASRGTRRLSCLRLVRPGDLAAPQRAVARLGLATVPRSASQRLNCTCAPVRDYAHREVARVGIFSHEADDRELLARHGQSAWELARLISARLGCVTADPAWASA